MTFKDDMNAADARYWEDAREERMMDILESCVNKIDELESDLEDANKLILNLGKRTLRDEQLIGIFDGADRRLRADVTIADLVTDHDDRIDEIDDRADDLDAQIDRIKERHRKLEEKLELYLFRGPEEEQHD